MKLLKPLLLAAAVMVGATSCATYQGTQEQTGMILGGILGGVAGAQVDEGRGRTAATIIGTMIGAAIGGNIGRSMDETDRLKTARVLETARTGAPSRWVNPDTRHEYTVTPTRTFGGATGPCREYTIKALIGGRQENIYGTACRQPDGSWKALN